MKRKEINSARTPVFRDAGFELYDAATTEEAFLKETEHSREPELYIYSRYRNPTVVAAEDEIAGVEGCDWALLTQTGMSAIDTALSVFQNGRATGQWLFFSEIYGGTISYIESVLKGRRGVEISYFTPSGRKYDIAAFEETVRRLRPSVVYIETVSNPMLIVADVRKITGIARAAGAAVIVDNTFATSLLYKPLEDGADIVIHSATKYLSGHGNLSSGVLCGNDSAIMKAAIEYRKLVGHMISPDDAYRLQTQVKTFDLRFARQCGNAAKLAAFLAAHPLVSLVLYPGLPEHPTHDVAAGLFGEKGYGAMITFDFSGENPERKRRRRDDFIGHVAGKIRLIPTLGDAETILMPVEAVWGKKYPEPGMIRLSSGFEDYEVLIRVIADALGRIS